MQKRLEREVMKSINIEQILDKARSDMSKAKLQRLIKANDVQTMVTFFANVDVEVMVVA